MGTASDVLRIAASQVGYDRYDDPQQGTKYGRWYAEYTGVPYFGLNGVPYCAMFVSWVLSQAGVTCPLFPTAVAFDMRDRSRMSGRYVDRHGLKAGDVVAFDWNDDGDGDHVGFVEKAYPDYVQTIEGNTGDGQVLRRTRYYSSIICGVRPYYGEGELEVDGYLGPLSVAAWQRAMDTYEDGIVSGQLKSNADHFPNLTSVEYGWGGSELVRAIQRAVGASEDGFLGPNTIKGIQRRLGVSQDGYLGPETAKAVQRSLNDGKWRS